MSTPETIDKNAELEAAGFGDAPAPYIPEDDEIESSGGATWRFAEGKIVTGNDDEGTLQTRDAITGILRRVGFFQGEFTDREGYKKPQHRLEAEVETRDGIVRVGMSLLNREKQFKVTRGALDFAWILTQMKPNTVYRITASQGEPWKDPKTGERMSPSTYVNLSEIVAVPGAKPKANLIMKPKKDPSDTRSMDERFKALEPELRKHPLYKEREAKDSGPTHFSELCKEMKARGIPAPDENPNAWLSFVAAAYKERPRAGLSDYDDDEWGKVRQSASADPEKFATKLKPHLDQFTAAAPVQPADDDYNPFLDS